MSRAPSGDTTQLDMTGHGSVRREERAYVMLRVGDVVDVRAIDEGEKLVLGRGEEADVVVDDTRVSRKHAEITLRDGCLYVKDLGSRNGTRVGGSVLRDEERTVARGDEIVVGSTHATVVALPAAPVSSHEADAIVVNPRMQQLFALVERLAAVPTAVLLCGETGVGKEIFAELLHRRGPRAPGPLVRLNCAAVPEANGLLPAETTPQSEKGRVGLEPTRGCLTGTCSAAELPTQSALRELNPPVQVGSLAPLPLGQGHVTSTAEAVGLEPTTGHRLRTCFRDRLLIQPDDFRARRET